MPGKPIVVAVHGNLSTRAAFPLTTLASKYLLLPADMPVSKLGTIHGIDSEVPVLFVRSDDPAGNGALTHRYHLADSTRAFGGLVRALGHDRFIVCVDVVEQAGGGFLQETFVEAVRLVREHFRKVKLDDAVVARAIFIPVSSTQQDNVQTKSGRMSWWEGVDVGGVRIETLVQAIETIYEGAIDTSGPTLIGLKTVYEIRRYGSSPEPVLSGRVLRGTISVGDRLSWRIPLGRFAASSSKMFATVTGLKVLTASIASEGPRGIQLAENYVPAKRAVAGDSVGITAVVVNELGKTDREYTSTARDAWGEFLALADNSLVEPSRVTALVYCLQDLDSFDPNCTKIKTGYDDIFHSSTNKLKPIIDRMKWKMGGETGYQTVDYPTSFGQGDTVELECVLEEPRLVPADVSCRAGLRIASRLDRIIAGRILRLS